MLGKGSQRVKGNDQNFVRRGLLLRQRFQALAKQLLFVVGRDDDRNCGGGAHEVAPILVHACPGGGHGASPPCQDLLAEKIFMGALCALSKLSVPFVSSDHSGAVRWREDRIEQGLTH